MDPLEGRMLAAKAQTMMTIAKDESSRDLSPSWYLARASSPSPGQSFLDIATVKPAEEMQFAVRSSHGEMLDSLLQRRIQEVWRTMAKEVEGLHGSMIQKENSVESLSREVLESKKFLWEELEAVQGELRCIHQKLKDQEVDITRNFVSIKKMQENQMKCTRLLTQLRGQIPADTSVTARSKPLSEELNDIWSAVNTLRNSTTNWSDKRAALRMKGKASRHHRKSTVPDPILSDSALHQHRGTSTPSS